MKNLFAIIGLVVTAKKVLELYREYSELKSEKYRRSAEFNTN